MLKSNKANEKTNVILADCDFSENKDFIEGLKQATKAEYDFKQVISNKNHGSIVENVIRYIKYFSLSFSIYLNRKKYNNIIAWQQFFGLILAFYLQVFNSKFKPNIYVMTFIYRSKKGIFGKIYDNFMRYVVRGKYIKRVIVFSKSEAEYYSNYFGVPIDHFQYIQLGINDVACKFNNSYNGEKYIISAGRSNRDYNFLIATIKNTEYKLKIVCDELNCKYDFVKIYNNCYENDFYKLLSKAYCVVISLDDENISSGQLVILQSMMFGKPVICTKNTTVYDYIDSGINGFIVDKSYDELIDTLNMLYKDEILYQYISKNARKKFHDNFSLKKMGENIGSIILDERYGDVTNA